MKRNVVEWIVLLASIGAIAILVAVIVAEGLGESRPADPSIELHAADARHGALGWILPATVANAGDEAAEAVVIEARAMVGGGEETSELEIDYLPAGTEVEVSFAFSAQPEGEVVARLVGFRTP